MTHVVDTNCCYFHLLRDSIWCTQTGAGTQYNFRLKIDGCGHLVIQSPNAGALNVTNPYLLTAGINIINGSYVAVPGDSVLCLTFVVSHGAVICKDTTICFPLHCGQHPLPCLWDYNHQVCQGSSTSFNYYGNPAGLTIAWNFTGGTPSTATGPGPHYITYNTPGVYPFTMTLTNANGSTTCTDSITVYAKPIASITAVGGTLNAFPAGMNYQWYTGPNLVVILGATNQFHTPPGPGYYCVWVSNNFGCSDSACTNYINDGIQTIEGDNWGIYPNPNDGSFTLSLDLSRSENVEMNVINVLGDVVDSRDFDLRLGSHKLFISNKSFAAGVYYVRIKTETWTSERRMVVK
jgi:PKD repeat protein